MKTPFELSDANHPYRKIANRVLEEVVAFNCEVSAGQAVAMENDIVALLTQELD